MNSNDPQEIPTVGRDPDAAAPTAATILDDLDGTPPPRLGIIHLLAWLPPDHDFAANGREKAISCPVDVRERNGCAR